MVIAGLVVAAAVWPAGGSEESAMIVTVVSLLLVGVGAFELLRSRIL
jgi:hypothetical protein